MYFEYKRDIKAYISVKMGMRKFLIKTKRISAANPKIYIYRFPHSFLRFAKDILIKSIFRVGVGFHGLSKHCKAV